MEAGAARLREAARARGLLPNDPDTSWPHGYRPPDPESRRLLKSDYTGPVYQQPAMDDYGYRHPGYSNPGPDGSHSADPRLEGMTYGEMHYDPAPGGSRESAPQPQTPGRDRQPAGQHDENPDFDWFKRATPHPPRLPIFEETTVPPAVEETPSTGLPGRVPRANLLPPSVGSGPVVTSSQPEMEERTRR